MDTPAVKVAVATTTTPTNELTKAAAAPASDRIPLTIRTRKVVRLAPPIDNGFRPFRVF